MKKIEFKKIEILLESILDNKNKVIDLIAISPNNNNKMPPDTVFKGVDAHTSVFIGSKASLFIALYTDIIYELTDINFDYLKDSEKEENILKEEIVEDIIIDIGKYIQMNLMDKTDDFVVKKYKSHIVYFYDLKNILKWFEVCKNNNLKIHII